MCAEGGEDSALHGSCHLCGRAHLPGERPAHTDGTTEATHTEKYSLHHMVLKVAVLLTLFNSFSRKFTPLFSGTI